MASKIIDFTAESADSVWAQDAADLAAAGEGKAILIEGPRTARAQFQRAARDAGITARCVKVTELAPVKSTVVEGKEKITDQGKFEFTFIAAPLREREVKAEADAE